MAQRLAGMLVRTLLQMRGDVVERGLGDPKIDG
jgi:hypothetical protein